MKCISPMSVPRVNGSGNTDRVSVPCGKCMACLQNKRGSWAYRLNQELKYAKNAYFVTLTYNENSLPTNNSLNKHEIQSFLKRLRHYLAKDEVKYVEKKESLKFKYYIVGEYGNLENRPHYHCIFFNLPLKNMTELSKLIDKVWNKGFVHLGSVNEKSIYYACKYVITDKTVSPELEPQFAIMSTKPAIGYQYIDVLKKWHLENQAYYALNNGKKMALPRYYRDKIFTDQEIRKNLINVQKMVDEKINESEKKKTDYHYADLMSKQQFEESSRIKSLKNRKL